MLVFQTEGAPPNVGRIILAAIGCTKKSSAALRKAVRVKRMAKLAQIVARRGGEDERIG
jgi:hypothetical protein